MKIKKAFTLAEVLVTVSIIGVVSALTITPIIKNYQKKVYVNQLIKVYNDLNTAFGKAMLNDMVSDFGKTKLIKAAAVKNAVGFYDCSSSQGAAINVLRNYLAIEQNYNTSDELPSEKKIKYQNLNNANYSVSPPAMFLKNGAILYASFCIPNTIIPTQIDGIKNHGGKMWIKYSSIYVDVNGIKKPNKLGRDLFKFYLAQDGVLYPALGRDDLIIMVGTGASDVNIADYCSEGKDGSGCAARIIQDNWQMNY